MNHPDVQKPFESTIYTMDDSVCVGTSVLFPTLSYETFYNRVLLVPLELYSRYVYRTD